MAAKFTMDAAETEAGLSIADAATAQQSGSNLGSLYHRRLHDGLAGGGYGCARGGEAQTVGRAAANTGSREFSIATVQSAEAGNSSVLKT